MARDFAKRRRPAHVGKVPARKKSPSRRGTTASHGSSSRGDNSSSISGWRWYLAGLVTGFLLSFLLFLGTLQPTGGIDTELASTQAATPAETPRPRFDFYTLLPKQTIEVEIEPAEVSSPGTGTANALYLLQAGSFRQLADADRRRAQLLLLGLEPDIEQTDGDNGRWYRVYVGPFDSRAKVARARSLTAGQNIDTLLLKRDKP